MLRPTAQELPELQLRDYAAFTENEMSSVLYVLSFNKIEAKTS